ncbi:MAG: amino-acid N-acetyltransferase [Gammaproteobacteria bacterium]|nr:MAG: amino-acid N-acetyltransferase [Gammaproteobacteria bacterium]
MGDHASIDDFVAWFRAASPYIHAHRGQTFVIGFGGTAVEQQHFAHFLHDVALLSSLGIRVVLVHGARHQIEARAGTGGIPLRRHRGLTVTDEALLPLVLETVGALRLRIEALLSMGLPSSPMAGARVRVASGNFVTARPLGVVDGVDYGHTGCVRRVDGGAIRHHLDAGEVVLIPPLGYSPSGEVFNLGYRELAVAVASELAAGKLILLTEGAAPLPPQLTLGEARRRLPGLGEDHPLNWAVRACESGIGRVHLVGQERDGALLAELFTRDGAGTLVSVSPYDDMRQARVDDVPGILELLEPLERSGVLVRRSREKLETEIDRFTVLVRDGAIIGCAALYPFPEQESGELACLVVHPDYRRQGFGEALLQAIERQARAQGLRTLVLLSTRTGQWFKERGFEPAGLEVLPPERRRLYNYQRGSRVFLRRLE